MRLRGSILMFLVCTCALVGASIPPAAAEDAIVFEPGYAVWLPVRPVGSLGPAPFSGDTVVILGRVSQFGGPLADLNEPPLPEYTYVFELTSSGWMHWYDPWNDVGGVWLQFTNGVLRIYRDNYPSARYDDRATFSNGEMLFEADCTTLVYGYLPGISAPHVRFKGGTLFDRVSKDGVGYTGTLDWSLDTDEMPADLTALGYRGLVAGTVLVDFPVGVEPATWGRLKTLYDH